MTLPNDALLPAQRVEEVVADEWAFLAASVVFPATLIANFDFLLVNDRRYAATIRLNF